MVSFSSLNSLPLLFTSSISTLLSLFQLGTDLAMWLPFYRIFAAEVALLKQETKEKPETKIETEDVPVSDIGNNIETIPSSFKASLTLRMALDI